MKIICFVTITLLMFVSSLIAQDNNRRPTAVYADTKGISRMIELSNMAGDVSECAIAIKPYTGVIVKRVFDDDELTIIGIVLRDSKDERIYLNIDDDQISEMTRADLSNFSSFLSKGNRIKAWAYMCGVSGGVLFASKVKAL